jgi:hypothetical protein
MGTCIDRDDTSKSTLSNKVGFAIRSGLLTSGVVMTLGMAAAVSACSSDSGSPEYIIVIQQAGAGGAAAGGQNQGGTPSGGLPGGGVPSVTQGGSMSSGAAGGPAVSGGNSGGQASGSGGSNATTTGGRSTSKGGRAGTGGSGTPSQGGSGDSGGDATGPEPTPPPPGPDLPTTTEGFTDLQPSEDSRVIYVSSSEGNDSNDGLTEDKPLKTVAKGLSTLRNGSPDWVLFKRGDVWKEAFGGWEYGGGRSPAERMVIGAYGEGERPRFDFQGTNILKHGGVDGPAESNNLVFVSLHFNGVDHDVTAGNTQGESPSCINWLRPAADVLFEDVRFQYCNVVIQAEIPGTVLRWRFFRSQFLDSYATDGEHVECMYLNGVSSLSIEESMFDLCGWHPDVPEAVPTIYNHCIYWQKQGPTDGLVRGNIIMRGASHGVQMRSSGRVLDNVFARNAIQGFLADDVPPGEAYGEAIGNVFLESEDTLPREGHPADSSSDVPRGWGWELLSGMNQSIQTHYVMKDNIFSHCLGSGTCQTVLSEFYNSEISNNLVWDWKSSVSQDVKESPGPFKDPDRTLASYNSSLGGEESFESFAAEIRKQSKTNWRQQYSADAVIEYIQEGFEAP